MGSLNATTLKKERKIRVAKSSAKQDILLAALEAFSKQGFNGVSTTDIANDVGVTQPLLHYHFKSKMDLFKACVDHAVDTLHPDVVYRVMPFIIRELLSDSERKDYILKAVDIPYRNNAEQINNFFSVSISKLIL